MTISTSVKGNQVLSNDVYLINKKNEATSSISTQKRMMTEVSRALLTLASIPFMGNIGGGKHPMFDFALWIAKGSEICPSALFPFGTTSFFSKYINYPNLFGLSFSQINAIVTMPILEELVDRVLLQEVLLKQVPKTIFKKKIPESASLIDHKVIRVARVLTSSVFFALHHSWAHTCRKGDMYPYLIAGVILGTFQEISGHPLYSLIAHMGANYLTVKNS